MARKREQKIENTAIGTITYGSGIFQQCIYKTDGRRCRMTGTINDSLHGDEWFCSWHHHTLNSGVKSYDKAKFMEWISLLAGKRSHWTQRSPQDAWSAVMAFASEAQAERTAIQAEGK